MIRSPLYNEAAGTPDGGGGAAAPVTPPEVSPAYHAGIWADAPGTFKDGWQSALPAEFEPYRAELANYRDLPSLVKALADNKAAARAKASGIVPPAPDAPEEVKQAFDAQLRKLTGVPDVADPTAYELDQGLPEGVSYDEASAKAFAEVAHKAGLNKTQAKALQGFYVEMQKGTLAAQEAAMKEGLAAEQAELSAAFGDKLTATVTQAQLAAVHLNIPPDVFDPASPNFMALKSADVLRLANSFAAAVGESRLPGAGAIRNLDPGTQAKDIQSNPANPYHARFMAGDQEVSKMVDGLLLQAVGRK